MKLEQQVCSLELAKKLEKLGVKQESAFYWTTNGYQGRETLFPKAECSGRGTEGTTYVSAFTVAELFKEHYDRFGSCDVPRELDPEKLADYLAGNLCLKLKTES